MIGARALSRDSGAVGRRLRRIVDVLTNQRHWVVRAPAGQTVEWDSVIVEDVPDELISWQSDASADITNFKQFMETDEIATARMNGGPGAAARKAPSH